MTSSLVSLNQLSQGLEIIQLLTDEVVVPGEEDGEGGRGGRHAEEARVGEGVRVELPGAVFDPDGVLLLLVVTVEDAERR